ncbi:hypothetical protein PG990_010123 [Apiospora arundinis]
MEATTGVTTGTMTTMATMAIILTTVTTAITAATEVGKGVVSLYISLVFNFIKSDGATQEF